MFRPRCVVLMTAKSENTDLITWEDPPVGNFKKYGHMGEGERLHRLNTII